VEEEESGGKGSFFLVFFETGSGSVAQAGLKLLIYLPLPPECWNYRCVPPCLAKKAILIIGKIMQQ
jgi:hypothetical protein